MNISHRIQFYLWAGIPLSTFYGGRTLKPRIRNTDAIQEAELNCMNSDEPNSDDSVTDPTFIAPSDMADDYERDEIVAERSNFIDQDEFPMNFEDSDILNVTDDTTEESSRDGKDQGG